MRLFTDYFDVLFIHRINDDEKILKLKEILKKFVTLPGGRQLTFCLEDIGFPHIDVELERFEMALQHSRYNFIYIGSDNCETDNADTSKWKFKQYSALNEKIEKRDRSIVPVIDNQQTQIPTLLKIFRPLKVWKLLKHRTLDDVSDVSKLGVTDIDERTLDFVRHMFDPSASATTS